MLNWRFLLICVCILAIPACTLWLLLWEISAAMHLHDEEPNFLLLLVCLLALGYYSLCS